MQASIKAVLAKLLPFAALPAMFGCTRDGRGDSPIPLAVDRLDLVDVRAEAVEYRGRPAIRVTADPARAKVPDSTLLAIVEGAEMAEGSISLFVAGALEPDAPPDARGFVGLAFHVQDRGGRHQAMYLRPTNGRAEDQLRRNHATQYHAIPGYPWHRLRSEQAGVYESYVDLEPDRWTEIRVELSKNDARLFVHDNPQPTLIVSDMKTPDRDGRIALWIGPGTVGYFAGLRRALPRPEHR